MKDLEFFQMTSANIFTQLLKRASPKSKEGIWLMAKFSCEAAISLVEASENYEFAKGNSMRPYNKEMNEFLDQFDDIFEEYLKQKEDSAKESKSLFK